jgi:hypothetical protein
MALGLASGCSDSGRTSPRKETHAAKETQKHEHAHEGPHHGAIAEWGDAAYHAEFTVNHEKKEARVYLLGADSKTPAPIKASRVVLSIKEPVFQVELKPEPQSGDPAGTASCFVGQHEKLGVVQEFAGTISGEVNGKPYAGDFMEDHAGHDHGK